MNVIIIDDEPKMGELIARGLARDSHETQFFSNPEEGLAAIQATSPDVVITDLKMPGVTGLDVLERTKRTNPNTNVILITAYASAQSAIEALRHGAYDYLIKPFPMDELLAVMKRLEETLHLRKENARLKEALGEASRFEGIVAESNAMRHLLELARRVAASDASVMLRGESGTGKEVLATAIHAASVRADGPIVRVNCGAIPETLLESELFGYRKGAFTGADRDKEGYFQAAHNGTLFLDEIGEVPPHVQVKLLRALQEKVVTRLGASEPETVNVRILAATNRDLESAIEDGTFREDLYYRLNVVPLEIPPLRERREDIVPLAEFFARRLAAKGQPVKPLGASAIEAMRRHSWPGNVRELQNAIEHAMVLATGSEVVVSDLPAAVVSAGGSGHQRTSGSGSHATFDGLTLEEAEALMITRALETENGNQTHAAKRLGITRRTLGYRMQRHGLAAERGKGVVPAPKSETQVETPSNESRNGDELDSSQESSQVAPNPPSSHPGPPLASSGTGFGTNGNV